MGNSTRLTLLLIAAGAAPFVWGWFVHWLISRVWPKPVAGKAPNHADDRHLSGPTPFDYQI